MVLIQIWEMYILYYLWMGYLFNEKKMIIKNLISLIYNCLNVKSLVEAGANVNNFHHDHSSAVFMACQNNHYDVVKFLIEHGAIVTKMTTNDCIKKKRKKGKKKKRKSMIFNLINFYFNDINNISTNIF
eukprot:TRINITY_DN4509_c0_g2_i1.p1 TRINITY_DN4509_c0_g2~~TRINITY_DN4509_c0_g2_i1.p1  ORF type:complete len:129 (+),score=12.43 TRINITY_DN4509_c0_g2_i1:120-506(+)